jgi:2-keto-4-pentenoate hydratase
VDTDSLATELLAALDGNRLIEPITTRHPGFDAAAAYRVSAEIVRRRRGRGETPIGRKIGFTNRTIWAEYGVSSPIWAHVYDTTVTFFDRPNGQLQVGHLSQPRLEPEIVLHFASAPAAGDEEAMLSSIDWIAHGYEVVQTHFPDWKFQAADTIADFGLHGALVIGPRLPVAGLRDAIDALRSFTITLATDGTIEKEGAAVNVLGGPLLAAAHLLRVLEGQQQFEPIQAGEVVTTGTLVSPPSIASGQTWVTQLSGIGLPGLRLQVQ